VGNTGTGSLTVHSSGQVSNTNGYVARSAGSSGSTMTVTGAGSQWTNNGELYVGRSGNVSLTIENGGRVSNTFGVLGYLIGSSGTVTVRGAGSHWTNSTHLLVGWDGTSSLMIADGGRVSNTFGYVGYAGGSSGTATVTGAGSH
jgi:T5SS/PEP-CTERM-associated repeat protein